MSTDLLKAAKCGDAETVRTLLAEGVDVNAEDEYYETALIMASEAGHLGVVLALLAQDADVDTENKDGYTALMTASLLAKGADVNVEDEDGMTALDAAQQGGHAKVSALLVKAARKHAWWPLAKPLGGFRTASESELRTAEAVPLDQAVKEHTAHAATAMADDLTKAAKRGDAPAVRALLAKGANV